MKQSMAFKIVCIGEPLAEITQAHSGFNVAFGGDTLNTAIYCARSATNDNTEVHYVSVVGNDLLSQGAVDLLESEGVQTKHVTPRRRPPNRHLCNPERHKGGTELSLLA